jgi:hypothetical protein
LLIPAAIVEKLELIWVCRANHSTLKPVPTAPTSNNSVKNTSCCIYSCLCSWWWVMVPLEHVKQFPGKINCVTLHLVGYISEYSYNIFFFTMLAFLHIDLQATDNEL